MKETTRKKVKTYVLRSVPRWLDWAVPRNAFRLGGYVYVAGEVARALDEGTFLRGTGG